MGRELAHTLWITDGIDRLENDAIYGLGKVYDYDHALARRLFAYTSEEPVQSRNTMFLGSLNEIFLHGREDKFELLIAQPWFTDGLNEEESAFVVAVQKTTGLDALYEHLLTSPRITRSNTISLPLSGPVTLWAFYNAPPPPDEDILAAMERGVRGAEGLIGAPFPLTDLIALSVNVDEYVEEYRGGYGGVNFVD